MIDVLEDVINKMTTSNDSKILLIIFYESSTFLEEFKTPKK